VIRGGSVRHPTDDGGATKRKGCAQIAEATFKAARGYVSHFEAAEKQGIFLDVLCRRVRRGTQPWGATMTVHRTAKHFAILSKYVYV
jgi:lysozyme family protein